MNILALSVMRGSEKAQQFWCLLHLASSIPKEISAPSVAAGLKGRHAECIVEDRGYDFGSLLFADFGSVAPSTTPQIITPSDGDHIFIDQPLMIVSTSGKEYGGHIKSVIHQVLDVENHD